MNTFRHSSLNSLELKTMRVQKLTNDQIDDLFVFCAEQNVKYYDLQIELVDHLANAIEHKWKEQPSLTYENALWSVYDEFGFSGFRRIRKAKEKALRKKHIRIQWNYIAEFYRFPKVVMTVVFSLFLFLIFRTFENIKMISVIGLSVYLVLLIVYVSVVYPKRFHFPSIPGKSFLILEQYRYFKWSIFSIGLFPFHILNLFNIFERFPELKFSNLILFELILAFVLTFYGIIMIAIAVHLPKRLNEDFRNEFPQLIDNK